MAINYLPFLRRDIINVPPRKADRVATGGFAVSDLARMATGGTQRAIVQELIIHPYGDDVYPYSGPNSTPIRIRIGVDGRTYMTEDLYDFTVYFDRGMPLSSVWDWSCGKKTPYRLYPGQRMTVRMEPSYLMQQLQNNFVIPVSVMFNCMKVPSGSPVGTKDGEPMMLYGNILPNVANAANADLLLIDSVHLNCPKDSPVDIYSVTLPECFVLELIGGAATAQRVHILDGNERPFWDSDQYTHTIDILASPITFGYGGCVLDPDETIRVDLEDYGGGVGDTQNIPMWVTYRGVLEVEDGR
jgi:hypothetical protein